MARELCHAAGEVFGAALRVGCRIAVNTRVLQTPGAVCCIASCAGDLEHLLASARGIIQAIS